MINEGEKQATEKNYLTNNDCKNIGIQPEHPAANDQSNVTNSTKEHIFKRLDKRKENLEQQRSVQLSERSKNAAETQSVLYKLNEWSNSILTRIETSNPLKSCIESNGKSSTKATEEYSAVLSSLSEDIQKFDSFFNEESPNLSPYDVRQTQAASVEIKEKFVVLQDILKPKKKFGFRSKCKKNVANQSNELDKGKKAIILDSPSHNVVNLDENLTADTGSYEVTNPGGCNVIEVPADQIAGRDVVINGLCNENLCQKLTVKILGSPGTLHATNMSNVTILCGPVRTSIFIENCVNCEFVVACQQLRIHTTKESNFYIHVTSKAIVEDCRSVGFAPYNLSYPKINEDFSNSGLNRNMNNWNKVDDFNWLSKEKPSPNWHLLSESQRTENWLS